MRHWWHEKRYWHDKSAAAARAVPEGRIGGVIAQLRQRGRMDTRRASVFLGFLLATVLLGLAYYIGLPLLRAYAEGTARTWQDQVEAAEAENAALDQRRADAISTLKDALALAPAVVWESTAGRIATLLALSDDTLIATGWNGTILRSTDGGATWARVGPQSGDAFSTPLALAGGALVVTGWSGTILRSTDRGATWERVHHRPRTGVIKSVRSDDFDAIRPLALADGTLVAPGRRGTMLRSTDDGVTWTRQNVGSGSLLHPARPRRWHADRDGRSRHDPALHRPRRDLDAGALGCAANSKSTPLALADGTLFIMEGSGTIQRSTDHGATWVQVRSGPGHVSTPLSLADGTLVAKAGGMLGPRFYA